MKAIVTGASSGLGRDMALYLAELGYDLALIARNQARLDNVAQEAQRIASAHGKTITVETVALDLAQRSACEQLFARYRDERIDLLVNNAGFGLFGDFTDTPLDRELEMINLTVVSYHVLTKLFVRKFRRDGHCRLLNVCSAAGFLAGPRLATYYATKNYTLKLTLAVAQELRRDRVPVTVSALCPGPVDTHFNATAGGEFLTPGASSRAVARYAIDKTLAGKLIIVPTWQVKAGLFAARFLPWSAQLRLMDRYDRGR